MNRRKRSMAVIDLTPISPLMLTPLLLKKSSGASRPIMVNTESLGIVTSLPSRSASVTSVPPMFFTRLFIMRLNFPGLCSPGMKPPVLDVRHRVGHQHLYVFHVLGL